MMWELLTDDERAFKAACRAFAEEAIRPALRACDLENRHPAEVHAAARAAGLLDVALPRELGGGGRTHRALAVGAEELAAVCAPTAFGLGFNHGALRPVLSAGTPAQRERLAGALVRRGGYAALCLTEEEASGSGVLECATVARRSGGRWRLSGTKVMVGNGGVADLFVVLAQAEAEGGRRGPTFFCVPRGPGVDVGPNTDKLGFRCVTTPTVRFDGAAVGDDDVLGEVGQAEPVLLDVLDFIRFGGAATILGLVTGALRDVVPWVEARRVGHGEPLVGKTDVQMALGQVLAELQAVRHLVWRAADLLDQGRPCSTETAAAKLLGSELAVRACDLAVQLLGWRGIDGRWPAEKRLRDARATTIYEGTSQVQRLNLFRALRRSAHTGGAF